MVVRFGVDGMQAEWPSATVVVGVYDGVHLGHQAVISQAVALARSHDEPCVLCTFDRHPAAVLAPERVPPAIAGLSQNLREFERLGVGVAVVLAFDAALAATTAWEFLRAILRGTLRAERLVVGHDFALGHGREGTAEWLAERIETQVVPPFLLDGTRVSSSAVRDAVATGRVDEAGRLLGRPFSLSGVVVTGQRLGRQLGYPTVNLARADRMLIPADGVYAGVCQTPIGRFKAAVSIGTRPTVPGAGRSVEAYLLDYPGEPLYGQAIEIAFLTRLRDELAFDSLDALREQMALDVQAVTHLAKL